MEVMNEQKLNELMESQEFQEKLSQAEDLDQVVAIFGEYGIEVEKEDLEKVMAMAAADNGELNEDELNDVVGGSVIKFAFKYVGIPIAKFGCWCGRHLTRRIRSIL